MSFVLKTRVSLHYIGKELISYLVLFFLTLDWLPFNPDINLYVIDDLFLFQVDCETTA